MNSTRESIRSRLPEGFSRNEFNPASVDLTRGRSRSARASRVSAVEQKSRATSAVGKTVPIGLAVSLKGPRAQSSPGQFRPRKPTHDGDSFGHQELAPVRSIDYLPDSPYHDHARDLQPMSPVEIAHTHGHERSTGQVNNRLLTNPSLHSLSFFSDNLRQGSYDSVSREQLKERSRSASSVAQHAVFKEKLR